MMMGFRAVCTRVDPETWDMFFRLATSPEGKEDLRVPSVCQRLEPGGPLTPVTPPLKPGTEIWCEISLSMPPSWNLTSEG